MYFFSSETENPNPISHLVNSRFFNIDKLRQWIKQSNLDPQNTENAAIFQFLQVRFKVILYSRIMCLFILHCIGYKV